MQSLVSMATNIRRRIFVDGYLPGAARQGGLGASTARLRSTQGHRRNLQADPRGGFRPSASPRSRPTSARCSRTRRMPSRSSRTASEGRQCPGGPASSHPPSGTCSPRTSARFIPRRSNHRGREHRCRRRHAADGRVRRSLARLAPLSEVDRGSEVPAAAVG